MQIGEPLAHQCYPKKPAKRDPPRVSRTPQRLLGIQLVGMNGHSPALPLGSCILFLLMLRLAPLILRNVSRNRRRSLLTLASTAVSLALLALLVALYQGSFTARMNLRRRRCASSAGTVCH